jgi:hypothetical protein
LLQRQTKCTSHRILAELAQKARYMTNSYIIQRRAASVDDLQATFARIDAERWRWAAERMAALGSASGAERARAFAAEHEMLADKLTGEAAIGAEEVAA